MIRNSSRQLIEVKAPRKTGRYRRASAVRVKPIDPMLGMVMDLIDDMLEAEKPKPRRESALLILRDEDPTFEIGEPERTTPDYGAIYRMIEFDRYPKPIREFFHEYGSDADIEGINFKKLNRALKEHPAELVAKALTTKAQRARQDRQFAQLNPVELKLD